jgi:hypothetical protein
MSESVEGALRLYAWNLRYAEALATDVPAELWAASGGPGLENHPAWTLGHLVTGSDSLAEDLGLPRDVPDGWNDLFLRRGPSDLRRPPSGDGIYPGPDELLAELRRQHERVAGAWRAASDAALRAPLEWRFDGDLPTLADAALFLAIAHETMHLGQLACWRRHHGLPSALAAM